MRFLVMFVTAVCVLFLIKLRWPKKKNFYHFPCFSFNVNKSIVRFGFCDIQKNQGLGKCFQPKSSASADNTYLALRYSGHHESLIQ